MKEKYLELLKTVKREGVDELINFLENSDFFIAPASTRYHGDHEGGLVEHSVKVYEILKHKVQNSIMPIEIPEESIILIALLHDICKTNFYKVDYRNAKNALGVWEKVPYYTVDDTIPYGHGEKSVMMITEYIKLTPEEKYSIRWHMGYTEPKENYNAIGGAYKKYPIALLTHEADLEATYLYRNLSFKDKRKEEIQMLAYIKGTLEMKMTEYIVIDVGGLGYKVFMSDVGIEKIGNIGENIKVFTYYRVREDDISIYGFNTLEELKMFELLIGVSGVGAKTALTMLAVCEPSEFALAVVSEDVKTLTGIPGIGPKSAQRIILELKDKITKEQQIENIKKQVKGKDSAGSRMQELLENKTKLAEAVAALQVLGYNKKEIEKAFEKLEEKDLSTEELIKKGLSLLG